jgi:hypothetical protein
MRIQTSLFAATLLAAGVIACDKEQEAEYPVNGGYGAAGAGYGQGAGYAQGAGYPQGGTGAADAAGGAGAAGAAGPAPSGNTATPIAPGMVGPIAGPILRALAQKELGNAQEDGTAFAGSFQPGQILEQDVMLQPGRCYSVVALGVGITELDIELVVHQPPAPEWVAATGAMTGPQEVLGAGQGCFKNPLPIGGPAKVRMRATGGTGMAVAQLYSR